MIYLEPRSLYDEAIIGQEDNKNIYGYHKLIDVLSTHYKQQNPDITWEEAVSMARDNISFNIEAMAPYYKDWPIIKDEE
jgi:hypothetical protein|tara:strand:+ start:29657 stop:29893 length:237 start_codon:yes stop_codon:yes gene_type:complete